MCLCVYVCLRLVYMFILWCGRVLTLCVIYALQDSYNHWVGALKEEVQLVNNALAAMKSASTQQLEKDSAEIARCVYVYKCVCVCMYV